MTDHDLHLRVLRGSDLDLVRQWRNHPDVRYYMYTQHMISPEEHRVWYERVSHDDAQFLFIFEQQGQPTGFVNFHMLDPQGKRADWGFYLAPEAPSGSGQALGQTALIHAFEHLMFNKVCGEALAYNVRSINFHERLGFTREATLRNHHFDGEAYHDVIGYGLLAADWTTRQGA